MTSSAGMAGVSKGQKKAGGRGKAFPYLMTAPYFLIYAVFGLFPIIYTLYLSFFDWNGITDRVYVGLGNYQMVIRDGLFWKTILNTLILAGLSLPLQLIIGFTLAAILSERKMPLKKTYRFLNFLPYITNSVAIGMVFSVLFTWRGGLVNQIIKALGLSAADIYWTGKAWPSRFMVAIMLIWKNAGYTSLFFAAGITNINPDLYEAAEIDGCGQLQRHVYITLPMLKNVTRFVVLTSMIGLLQLFDELYCLFGGTASNARVLVGGPQNAVLTTVWYMYDKAFGSVVSIGYAASIAYGLFVVILAITLVTNKVLDRRD